MSLLQGAKVSLIPKHANKWNYWHLLVLRMLLNTLQYTGHLHTVKNCLVQK